MKRKIISLSVLVIAIVALMLVFVSCDDVPSLSKELDPVSNISYDGSVITWQGVSNAEKYSVSINGQDGVSTPGTMWAYTNSANEAFTVSITAKADEYEDSDAVSKQFIPLGDVSEIRVGDDGEISFDPVSGATYYLVNVDGTDNKVYTLSYSGLEAGTHTVKVCAGADSESNSVGYYSKYSAPKIVIICGEVDEKRITFNSLSNTLSWMGVSGAAGYEISIQTTTDIYNETVNKTSYQFDPHNANFSVSIRAIGNHSSSFDSKTSAEKRFVYLETARNVHLEDGILYWDEIAGADGYKLRLNNSSIVSVKEPQYSGLPISASVDVEIMAVSNEDIYFASWSARETFKILPAPVLQWKGDHDAFDGKVMSSVVWDAVENAEGYVVSVAYAAPNDKEPGTPTLTTLSKLIVGFEHDYLDVGTYYIKVKSLANDADPNTSDSKYSQEIKVIRLASPTLLARNAITSTSDNLQDGVTISFNTVSRATEYRVWKENNMYQVVTGGQFKDYEVIDRNVVVEQLVNYKIQSIGKNATTESGITTVVLDSLTDSMMNVSIKVLAAPTVNAMSGYIYSYNGVQGAYGYNVSVNGQNTGRDNTYIDLSYLESGTFDVKVCARGNGADVLASNYTETLQIYRLMSPYDIRIKTDNVDEGALSFSSDPNQAGSGFELFIDGSETAIPVDNMTNVKQYITTSGTDIFMRASANRYNETNTVYLMTSPASETLHIKKLMPVTYGDNAFTNTQLIWNTSSGAIKYEVYNAQEILYGSFDGASMPLDSLVGGNDYTFKVKAIGNGIDTFNSDFSDQKSIYKLKTPELRIDTDRYKWNAVSDATSYAVYIDGELASLDVHVSGEEYYVIPNFTKLKTYTVSIKAIGDGGRRTIDSTEAVVEQETRQLPTPDFKISYSEKSFKATGEIIVDITQTIPYANGYAYIVGGVTTSSNEVSFRYNPNGAGTYMIGVYAIGGLFDSDDIYCLPSQTCGNNSAYSITLLGSTNESSIKLSMDGRISWGAVEYASSYSVKLKINGEAQELITVYTPAYDLSNITAFKNVNSLEIEIQAHGNDKCVSSSITTKTWPVVTH